MPVTAFTSRVKNAGKRRDECGDRGVEEKKKLPPPSYIICCTADWCMFVPRWEIFTSEYIFQWDKHASTSTRTTNTGTFGIRSMRAPRILYTYMPSWSRDTYMNAQKVHVCKKKKKKKRSQQCKRADENKKSCSQTALSFNQWEVQNYACKKTEMLKSKITLCNIPGH